MEYASFCQSCSMPLDHTEFRGTEMDGSLNRDYCKFCYHNGAFTEPGMTLDGMRSHIISKMDKEKIPADIIETAVARLPFLKRWKAGSAEGEKN